MQDEIDTKALAYAQKREGRCLGKGHQWETCYQDNKQNYR
ncbi:2175_t:CDS:2 [Funneliformis caledonium]|uniref:2175_t:CDS:1 n=1 Tax=Funneliformis caledonium TaxID=1117310 RepID=A0A9N8V6Z0_9GLOM|nr:2175_t:CDS:2 [Funneliformis caledonium]